MPKYLLLFILNFLLIETAICQKTDTTVIYFKYFHRGYSSFDDRIRKVSTVDSADFIRTIMPAEFPDKNLTVKEFYMDGTIKLLGKYDADTYNNSKVGLLMGDCITYFMNGKKESIIHYKRDITDSYEYWFYPTGKIYCAKLNSIRKGDYYHKTLNQECYDKDGATTCVNGNGEWIVYNEGFNQIKLKGNVVNGLFEGDWHGKTMADSINYTFKFKNGFLVSGIGYDKSGKACPFKNEEDFPSFNKRWELFSYLFKSNLILPKNEDGTKMILDKANLSFTIERDDSISDFNILDTTNIVLKAAAKDALIKCGSWSPYKLYGVPFKTKVIVYYIKNNPYFKFTWEIIR